MKFQISKSGRVFTSLCSLISFFFPNLSVFPAPFSELANIYVRDVIEQLEISDISGTVFAALPIFLATFFQLIR